MADPATILSIIAASLTITLRPAAIRVAVRSLSTWLEDGTIGSEAVEDVKEQLLEVISVCCELLSDLQDHVAKAIAGAESVGFKGAISYIWDEEIIKETTETPHHQETAIILMLQALQSLDRKEQHNKLRGNEVIQALTRAKRPSSSILG